MARHKHKRNNKGKAKLKKNTQAASTGLNRIVSVPHI